jgi:DMSO/TMAO reductase YedYZ molybdopterin-dependent catalytic subunit
MPSKTSPSKSNSISLNAALGFLATLALVGLLALGHELLTLPFVPFDIFDWMARTLPGALIGFVIHTMVAVITALQGILPIGPTSTVAKLAEQSIAVIQFLIGGAIFGVVLGWLRTKRDPMLPAVVGALLLLAFTVIVESSLNQVGGLTLVIVGILFIGWGLLLARLIQRAAHSPVEKTEGELSRRQFLAVSGASLTAAALGAWGLSKIFGEPTAAPVASQPTPISGDPFGASLTSGPAASPSPEELAARIPAVQGTRPELTENKDFYRIDINTLPPNVGADEWRLKVNGLVAKPLELTLDEVRAMPSQTQILTMQCISNLVGGDLTSASRWTGVRTIDMLAAVGGVTSGAAGAYITSTDGFYEFVTMEDLQDERSMLVYAMNGEPLPTEHGFPLRIYIPNRYGMKQPKWIENIELVNSPITGYWVERGWVLEARPETVSVVDTVVVDPGLGQNGMAIGGGIAWAGTRGISKVEVQVDEAGWQAAELITPTLSPMNWVLWRFAFPYVAGRHTVEVRAYDGTGTIQISDPTSPGPGAATGIHSVTVNL